MSKKLLIIDSDLDSRESLARILVRRFACRVMLADSITQASQCMEISKFDLIISDFTLGFESGVDLVIFLNSRSNRTPLIFYSVNEIDPSQLNGLGFYISAVQKPAFDKLLISVGDI